MNGVLTIPHTLSKISKCWNDAEVELHNLVEKKHHDLDEEFITKLFYGEFRFQLERASATKIIENAFLADLQKSFPGKGLFCLNQFSTGLVAEISLHKREQEKVTGGDFGLTIMRPQISQGGSGIVCRGDYIRGLLCQAKIKRRNDKWGNFSRKQNKILPDHLDHLGLLLYSYADAERRNLNQFQWQTCKSASFDEIKDWLKRGSFPSLLNSNEVISQLGNGHVGTDSNETIEQFIKANNTPRFEIKIGWPPKKRPPGGVHVQLKSQLQIKQQLGRT